MTATSMQGPLGRRIRHTIACPRRGPLLEASRILDNGDTIHFRRCSSCNGTDLDSALVDQLLPDPPKDAA